MHLSFKVLALSSLFIASTASIAANASSKVAFPEAGKTHRMVVTFKAGSDPNTLLKLSRAQVVAHPGQLAVPKKSVSNTEGPVVVALPKAMTVQEANDLAAQWSRRSDVAKAEPDWPIRPSSVLAPDPDLAFQWNLTPYGNSAIKGSANFAPVWARSKGQGQVVAVLDTGHVNHPELAGQVIPGYDFVSDPTIGGDSDGRDADPTDPGDHCMENGALVANSSWHGTKVMGIIAAKSDSVGITGAAPESRVLSVRVLGRCNGWASDLVDAMRWSVGLPVAGAPTNPNPAKILNLSLATQPGVACPSYLQNAINDVTQAGAVVVAATGNDGQLDIGAPASCNNVVAVTAHNASADLANYANINSKVTLSGPAGGECKSGMASCLIAPSSTLGVKGDMALESFLGSRYIMGTSAATPYVSSALALLKSIEPTLTPEQTVTLLRQAARPLSLSGYCKSPALCGFGMLDVEAAVKSLDALSTPLLSASASKSKVFSGTSFNLTAKAEARSESVTFTYRWSLVSGPAPAEFEAQSSLGSLVLTAPEQTGTMVFDVVATASNGKEASARVSVEVVNNKPPKLSLSTNEHGYVGQTWRLEAAAFDPEGDAVRLRVLVGPDGLKADGLALIWEQPEPGLHEVVVQAVDDMGQESDPVTLSLVIYESASQGSGSGGGDTGLPLALAGLALSLSALRKRGSQKR